ncbi:hypothetical protein DM02DRAFT_626100 [Periconia macrospinosa]|uniref:Polysaccharide lyase family 14 protein n=1 Tax=Periconia macrospinosa TaxID=97972 RepID=A0A2V1E1B4_9PLEO|nr:hypothetical protein DM02DRAFT_626100 [Periconia macrospinosa]
MKLTYTPFLSILWATQTSALPADPSGVETFSPLPDPAALFKRAPRDCGTFKFKCARAAGACNNACYYINCVNNKNAQFAWGSSPVDNRIHSGCTTTTKSSLCRLTPFSQRVWDRQPDSNAPKPLQCDEFPMNAFKQTEFKEGTVRNSLRCINGGENGSGGSQFGQFRQATGDWAKGGRLAGTRTCDGAMNDGDTFKVDWIIDGDDGIPTADQDRLVPYCKPNPNCANDGYQFHMSKLQLNDGGTGIVEQPYNYNTNNRYALTGKSDMKQYRVKVFRNGGSAVEVEVFEVFGSEEVSKGKKAGEFGDKKQIEVTGLPKSLFVFGHGGLGTEVTFSYTRSDAATLFDFDFPNGDMAWGSGEKGIAGDWCQVGGVNMVSNTQWIYCDFVGLAAPATGGSRPASQSQAPTAAPKSSAR